MCCCIQAPDKSNRICQIALAHITLHRSKYILFLWPQPLWPLWSFTWGNFLFVVLSYEVAWPLSWLYLSFIVPMKFVFISFYACRAKSLQVSEKKKKNTESSNLNGGWVWCFDFQIPWLGDHQKHQSALHHITVFLLVQAAKLAHLFKCQLQTYYYLAQK